MTETTNIRVIEAKQRLLVAEAEKWPEAEEARRRLAKDAAEKWPVAEEARRRLAEDDATTD